MSALRAFEIWQRPYLFDPLTATAIGLSVAGTAVSAVGTLAGGNAAKESGIAGANAERQAGKSAWEAAIRGRDAKEFEALQLEQAGRESLAAGQRSALDKRREGQLLASKLRARAAASGGGATDPTVLDLGGQLAGRTEYEALTEMFKGENRARGLYDSATGSRLTGEALLAEGRDRWTASQMNANARLQSGYAQQGASKLAAAGTIIGGAGSAFSTYNKLPTKPSGGGYNPGTGWGYL